MKIIIIVLIALGGSLRAQLKDTIIFPQNGDTLKVIAGKNYIITTAPVPYYIKIPAGKLGQIFGIEILNKPCAQAPVFIGAAILLPQVTGDTPWGTAGDNGNFNYGAQHRGIWHYSKRKIWY